MKEYKLDPMRIGMYDNIIYTNDLDKVISAYFDYLLRLNPEEYTYFLNYIYSKYTYKSYEIIITGILKNMMTLMNYTFDELDREKNFQRKKYILKIAKQIKDRDRIIEKFRSYKVKEQKEYTKRLRKKF